MPNKRIPPSERVSKEIMELIEKLKGGGDNQEILAELIKLSIKKLLQEILEAEVEEYIGKEYYERGKDREGYRNGYKPAHIKTAEGKIRIEKPQVSDTKETFQSEVWKHIEGNTEQLERIAIEMYVRGCSTRDIEELLKDKWGRVLLSKSAISQLNKRLWEEYEAFCKRDLSGYDVVYIYIL